MNKKLIALAVAGAFVAPAVMAQTANPVTLYGRVSVTAESVEAKGGSTPVPRRNRVEDQSSFLGVRGTEDLGGGLKAFFQLETAFRADQNNTSPTSGVAQPFGTRNSAVGLQGGWGSILMGRWDMPYKVTAYVVDAFGDITIGGITGVGHDRGNFDRRDQNVVQYWSPNFGGVAFRLAATANEGKTATLNPRDAGANITYTRGPWYAFAAWEEHKDVSATVSKEEGISVGGYFNIGPVKLGALAEEIKRTGATKRKSWLGSVVYTLGNNQLIYQYQQAKDGNASNVAQPDCDSNTLGYKYNFSRRTFFLAQYVKVDNNSAASCNFGSNALTITNGQDPQGVSLGINHVF